MDLKQIFKFNVDMLRNSIPYDSLMLTENNTIYCDSNMQIMPEKNILSGQADTFNSFIIDYCISITTNIEASKVITNFYITFHRNIKIKSEKYYNIETSKDLINLIKDVTAAKNIEVLHGATMYWKLINVKTYAVNFMEKVIKEIGLINIDTDKKVEQLLNQ